jgi:hypothetical protein
MIGLAVVVRSRTTTSRVGSALEVGNVTD